MVNNVPVILFLIVFTNYTHVCTNKVYLIILICGLWFMVTFMGNKSRRNALRLCAFAKIVIGILYICGLTIHIGIL